MLPFWMISQIFAFALRHRGLTAGGAQSQAPVICGHSVNDVGADNVSGQFDRVLGTFNTLDIKKKQKHV